MPSKWYYRIGNDKHGPIESRALKLLAEVGQITPDTLVQKEGANSWAEASRVKGLFKSKQTDTIIAPPVLADSAAEENPAIPVATEYAHKVTPAEQRIAESSTVAAPEIITNPDGLQSHKEFLEHKRRRKSPMPLIFTALGIFVVAGLGCILFYNYDPDSLTEQQKPFQTSNNTLSNPIYPPAESDSIEQLVFMRIPSYSDASKARTRIANGKIQLRIIDVWLNKPEKDALEETTSPEFTLHILLETENLDPVNAFTMQREPTVETNKDSLNPYTVLARNANDQFTTLKQDLLTKTIPAGGKITETLSFLLESEQLEDFKLAIPLAWFRQTGYTGYTIPAVMIARAPAATTIAQTPADESNSNIEEAAGSALTGQGNLAISSAEKVSATEGIQNKGNGQLPAPPDFGIPNKPDGVNGDQPEDIKTLQQSIRSSVKPLESGQEADRRDQAANPIFK